LANGDYHGNGYGQANGYGKVNGHSHGHGMTNGFKAGEFLDREGVGSEMDETD
jgi:hypothetical protein